MYAFMVGLSITIAGVLVAWPQLKAVIAKTNKASSHTQQAALHLHNNPGGDIDEFQANFAKAKQEGRPIIISGDCYSACTLALSYGACVMPGTRLGYHAASEYGPGIPLRYSLDGTAIVEAAIPSEIKQFLRPLTVERIQYVPASKIPSRYWCKSQPVQAAQSVKHISDKEDERISAEKNYQPAEYRRWKQEAEEEVICEPLWDQPWRMVCHTIFERPLAPAPQFIPAHGAPLVHGPYGYGGSFPRARARPGARCNRAQSSKASRTGPYDN